MKTRITLLCLIACAVLPVTALGQGFTAGDRTLGLSGSGASDDDLDNTILQADVSLGYFFSDNLAGEFRQGVSLIDVPGSSNDYSGATRVAVDYYLGTQDLCPLVGASLGYIYGDNVSDTWIAGPEVGLNWFVNETTYIMGSIEYDFFFSSGNEVTDAFDDGQFVYTLGIGFKF
ncbi:MAG: hypothetical protein P8Z79_23300 [Sedimentisphaerales bacterium]